MRHGAADVIGVDAGLDGNQVSVCWAGFQYLLRALQHLEARLDLILVGGILKPGDGVSACRTSSRATWQGGAHFAVDSRAQVYESDRAAAARESARGARVVARRIATTPCALGSVRGVPTPTLGAWMRYVSSIIILHKPLSLVPTPRLMHTEKVGGRAIESLPDPSATKRQRYAGRGRGRKLPRRRLQDALIPSHLRRLLPLPIL